MPQIIATLDQPYATMGVTWVEEFLVLQNADRAILGLPAILFMGEDVLSLTRLQSVDISQRHSEHEAAITFQAHDSGLLPVGWQTSAERIAKVTPLSGAENLLFSSFFQYSAQTFNYITPADAYAAWFASPLHREILMWDYTPSDIPVYSSFGLAVSDAPASDFGVPYGTVSTLFITNVFLQLEAVTMEAILSQSWETIGCTIGLLGQQYELVTYTKVRSSHTSEYMSTVAGFVDAPYACGVAAQHSTQTHYGVTAYNEITYVGTAALPATPHTLVWDTRQEVVSAPHTSVYSLSVAASLASEYEDSSHAAAYVSALYDLSIPIVASLASDYGNASIVYQSLESSYDNGATVRASHDSLYEASARPVAAQYGPYGSLVYVQVGMDSPYADAYTVMKSLLASYAGTEKVRTQNVASSFLPTPVRSFIDAPFDLGANNPALAYCDTRYALSSEGSTLDSRAVHLIHDGVLTRVSDGYVSTSVGNPGYEFNVQIADMQVYASIAILDTVVLDFSGELYTLVVTSKTMARNSPANISATISGLSPVYLLDLPYADQIVYTPSTSMMMSEIVQDVLGQAVSWEIVDWLIPVGRAQTAGGVPLAFVKTLLASVRASIQSRPDGSLVARYDYPTNWDILQSISINHEIEEVADILSLSVGYEYRKGFNRFHIKDSDTEFKDTIDWDQETEVATVTPYPYRSSWVLATTAVSGINIQALGEDVATITDIVEFKGGIGSLTKPIITLVSTVWLSADLGSMAFDPYSTQVQCGVTVNQGYGLAKITYLSKSYKFNVTSPTAVEAAQLVVKEN